MRGDDVIASQLRPSAKVERASAPLQGQHCLTLRETQIAGLIALGQTSGQIALELGVSLRTVDAHAEHIRKKLKVRSRVQIAAWAVGQGLLGTTPS